MYSVQRSLDPVPGRSLLGRHNSGRGFCFARLALDAISVKTGLWSENGGNISIMLTAVGLLVTSRSRVLPRSCVAPFTTFSRPLSWNISRHLSCFTATGWPDTWHGAMLRLPVMRALVIRSCHWRPNITLIQLVRTLSLDEGRRSISHNHVCL